MAIMRCAPGINRHVVGVQVPCRKGSSDSILTSPAPLVAWDIARCSVKRRPEGIGGQGALSFEKSQIRMPTP